MPGLSGDNEISYALSMFTEMQTLLLAELVACAPSASRSTDGGGIEIGHFKGSMAAASPAWPRPADPGSRPVRPATSA
jgi:hypothetical protein